VAIRGFRHKGLKEFFATGNRRGIQARQADRMRLILGRLNAATDPRDMRLPGLGRDELKGARRGTWAVTVSGNWRVTFEFAGKDAERVGCEDCH
jgi:proteic killer suppression protein